MQSEDLTTDSIRRLLAMSEPPPYCSKPRTIHIRHLHKRGEHQAARVGCDAWGCLGCGMRKRLKAGVNIATRFMDSTHPIGEEFCPPDGWDRLRQRLHRAKADYAKIADPSGGWWVFHTAGGCSTRFKSLSDAVRRLGERLHAIRPVKRGRSAHPVQTSRRWSPPKGEREYELLGLLPVVKPDELRRTLEEAGVKVRAVNVGERAQWAIGYRLDEGEKVTYRDGGFELSADE